MSGNGRSSIPSFTVPFARRGSLLDANEVAALSDLVNSGDSLSAGTWRDRFEERFRKHIGTRYAMSVTSGTVALELAIHLLDLAPGDEVIVTPQTYHATIQPLLDRDVHVRFCDIEPDSLNMDPAVLQTLINDRTRAIVLVHYGGYPARMREVMALARSRGIVVVEDCAHALGSEYHGRRPGALGDIGCFSFHTTKNITTLGEGGMLTFDRDDWADRVQRLRSNEVDGTFVPQPSEGEPGLLPWMKYSAHVYQESCVGIRRAGTNATLSEAGAAVGLVQLDKLGSLVDRRRAIAAQLDEVVDRFEGARAQRPDPRLRHAYHLYTFFMEGPPQVRENLVRALDRRGVEVQLRYFPLHLLPEWRWRGHGPGECPVAERLWFSDHVNLPCHPGMSDAQVRYLVETLETCLAEAGRTREEHLAAG